MQVVAIWVVLSVGAAKSASLRAMEKAYRLSEFEQVIALGAEVERKGKTKELPRVHELCGLAHFFLDDIGNAEVELRKLLALTPTYTVDAKRQPPGVVKLVEDLKAKIEQEKNPPPPEVPEAPSSAASTAPAEVTATPASTVVASTPVERAPPEPPFNALRLIPFGIGQLATGDVAAGVVFLSLDVALLGANLGLYFARLSERRANDDYPDASRATALLIAQNVTAGALVASALIGLLDALVWSPRRVALRTQVVVLPSPAGLSLVGSF